jgi:hypothetical protein
MTHLIVSMNVKLAVNVYYFFLLVVEIFICTIYANEILDIYK